MNKSLEEISDGKRYGLNDMVRAACNDCAGCSSCCEDMGESILLDPLDIYMLTKNLNCTFENLKKKDAASIASAPAFAVFSHWDAFMKKTSWTIFCNRKAV